MKRLVLMGLLVAALGSARAQKETSGCQPLQGKFKSIGEADSRYWQSKRLPTFWMDVLSRMPQRDMSAVLIESIDQTHLRFRPILSPNVVSDPVVDVVVECLSGRHTFAQTMSGGAEGWHGTVTRTVQLSLSTNGDLLADVADKSVGKDFYVFPRTSHRQFEFRFPRVTNEH